MFCVCLFFSLCFFDLTLLFFNSFQKMINGMVDYMTAMVVLYRFYVTQCHSLFTLTSYFTIVFSFTLMFTNNWFP